MTETGPIGTDELRRLVAAVGGLVPASDDAERIERVRLFEELQARAAAVQAETAVEFAASQRAEQAAAGVPAERRDRGIAAQLGLARRISPWSAARWLGFARIATRELPDAFAQLRAGRTSVWRVMLLARETAVLSREQRARVDAELAPRLEQLGDRQVERLARAAAYRLDPAAAVNRARRAQADRRVAIRPAPDTMCWLGALLPVAQGVAAYAALGREADHVIGTGADVRTGRCRPDGAPRTRSQVMADTLVERLTGQTSADGVPVEINLIMTEQVLTDSRGRDGQEPAVVPDYGPIPAGVARDLAYSAFDSSGVATPRWLRRLYTAPGTGQLVAMDSPRRTFTAAQRDFLRLRDQTCRTPWCDAPIRHADHVDAYLDGGPTSLDNAQGYCVACNHAKQAPGWHQHVNRDLIIVMTPTRHSYRSRAPDPPGSSHVAAA